MRKYIIITAPLVVAFLVYVLASPAGRRARPSQVQQSTAPRLLNLQHVNDPIQLPERDIRKTWITLPPYLGSPPQYTTLTRPATSQNPDYVVQPNDVIELYVLRRPSIEGRLVLSNERMTVALNTVRQKQVPFIADVRHPKFPVSILNNEREATTLTITIDHPLKLIAEVKLGVLLGSPPTWGAIRARFLSARFIDAMNQPNRSIQLAARLIPSPAEYALPGDAVVMTRMFDDDRGERKTQQFRLRVDPEGYLWIPPLTTGTVHPRGHSPVLADAFDRRIHGSIDRSSFRVRVSPNGNLRAVPLSKLSDLMSSLNNNHRETQQWADYGLDDQFVPKAWTRPGIRYMFTLGEAKTWTLIDENGRRLVVKHRGHELLIESVMRAYRVLAGRELVERLRGSRNQAYITVCPSGHSTKRTKSAPFCGRIDTWDLHADLKFVALLAGDTVIISRTSPQKTTSTFP